MSGASSWTANRAGRSPDSMKIVNKIPLRGKFLVAPGIGLLLMMLMAIIFLGAMRQQETVFRELEEREFATAESFTDLYSRLSINHNRLYELLYSASMVADEELIFEKGHPLLHEIHKIEASLKSNISEGYFRSADLKNAEEVQSVLLEYRRFATTAIEMASVDLELANRHMRNASTQFNRVNMVFLDVMQGFHNKVSATFVDQIHHSDTQLLIFTGLVFLAVLAMGVLSILLSRFLSADIDKMITALRQLASGDKNIELPAMTGSDDVAAMASAVHVFKGTLDRLEFQASFDPLTQLPNRALALDRLTHAIKHAERQSDLVGVLFIDVDFFKHVNDTHGHAAGDSILVEVARRLTACVRSSDTVARFGGDEFAVILGDLVSLDAAAHIAEQILKSLSKPFVQNKQEFFLGASIGITSYPNDGENPDMLLQNADTAMYQAKESGRNTYRFFKSAMNTHIRMRLAMESQLRHALEKQEFHVEYQPQIDITDNSVIGAEALLRWRNHELGSIRPDQFIPLAEDTGLIVPIGKWILHNACCEAKKWQEMLEIPIPVSVNVSYRQFRDIDFEHIISSALVESGLPPYLLTLEITESLLMDDRPETLTLIQALTQLGIRVVLDDFGTGYSSLSYLRRYPFKGLKIDRAFIRDCASLTDSAKLCKSIIAMADSLGMEVVAEGVETDDQLEFLQQNSVKKVQGFYFSRPLPAHQFQEFITQIPVPL